MVARVRILDDNPDILRSERRMMQAHGYDVTPAADGEQALADIERDPPDLILTDLTLLRRHAAALRQTLAARGVQRPALLVSSVDEPPSGVGIGGGHLR